MFDRRSRWAFTLSMALHAVFAALLSVGIAKPAHSSEVSYVERPDIWVGNTVDIDDLLEAEAEPAAEAAEPERAEPNAPTPKEVEPNEAEPKKSVEPAPKPPTPPVDEYGESWLPDPIDPADGADEEEEKKSPPDEAATGGNPAPKADPPKPPTPTEPVAAPVAPSASGDGTGASFGSKALPGGVRNLAKAFARALPIAGYHDRTWKRLPVGEVGRITVTITIDDEGKIASTQTTEEAPRSLRELVRKTLLHLKIGRFALARGVAGAGTEVLGVEVVLSDREKLEDAEGVQIGFTSPRPGTPGSGYFTLTSGRHLEAKVTIESSKPLESGAASDAD